MPVRVRHVDVLGVFMVQTVLVLEVTRGWKEKRTLMPLSG
jgi:hypothetical protein